MNEPKVKVYDLENRTLLFALSVRQFVKKLQKNIANIEDIKQVIRSSGSIGANYIEANESLSDKDFVFRIKICRKEAKETVYWLTLLDINEDPLLMNELELIKQEATELMKIFGAIIIKKGKE